MLAQNGIIAIYSEDTAPDIRFIINDSMEEGIYNVDLTLSDGLDSTTYTIEVYIIKKFNFFPHTSLPWGVNESVSQ